MNIGLLKKVRKRYSITHYPDGCYAGSVWCKGPVTILRDVENDWRNTYSSLLKDNAYNELYIRLKEWINNDNPHKGKRKKLKVEKLWYKF